MHRHIVGGFSQLCYTSKHFTLITYLCCHWKCENNLLVENCKIYPASYPTITLSVLLKVMLLDTNVYHLPFHRKCVTRNWTQIIHYQSCNSINPHRNRMIPGKAIEVNFVRKIFSICYKTENNLWAIVPVSTYNTIILLIPILTVPTQFRLKCVQFQIRLTFE